MQRRLVASTGSRKTAEFLGLLARFFYWLPSRSSLRSVASRARFPDDFMFGLTRSEVETLNRSKIATGSQKHRDPRFPLFAFTEHGAIQAANVLDSPEATEMVAASSVRFCGCAKCLPRTRRSPVSPRSWRLASTAPS